MDGNYNHQQGPHDDTIAFMPPVIALQASTLQLKEPTTDTVHNELALVDTQPQVKNLEAHSRTVIQNTSQGNNTDASSTQAQLGTEGDIIWQTHFAPKEDSQRIIQTQGVDGHESPTAFQEKTSASSTSEVHRVRKRRGKTPLVETEVKAKGAEEEGLNLHKKVKIPKPAKGENCGLKA